MGELSGYLHSGLLLVQERTHNIKITFYLLDVGPLQKLLPAPSVLPVLPQCARVWHTCDALGAGAVPPVLKAPARRS